MNYRELRKATHSTLRAASRAKDAEKARARNAAASLGRPFVYNGFLNLLQRGVAPTEANILAEAQRLERVNEDFFNAIAQREQQEAA